MAVNDDWADLSDEALAKAVLAELPDDPNAWTAASYMVKGRTIHMQELGVSQYRKRYGVFMDIVADRLRAIGRLKRHLGDPRPWTAEEMQQARKAALSPDKGRAARWASHIKDGKP